MKQDPADTSIEKDRRTFFTQVAAGLGLLALAPGVRLIDLAVGKNDEQAVTGAVRWGMFVDTTKCAEGCTACVDACNEENGLTGFGRPETDAQWIRKLDLEDEQTGKTTSLPMLCQHCENPPCVDVCPTGASFVRADGIVLVDKHTCIGCRYCMMACPYKARSFIHEDLTDQRPYSPRGKGTVESCTFCVHRVDRGRTPACVEACTHAGYQALTFGDLNDDNSAVSEKLAGLPSTQVRADLGLNTGVRYHGI
jgi:molybdopterin-containing oxidoreductase family iron-sulfur binding subunit